jgi:hypothetical protein
METDFPWIFGKSNNLTVTVRAWFPTNCPDSLRNRSRYDWNLCQIDSSFFCLGSLFNMLHIFHASYAHHHRYSVLLRLRLSWRVGLFSLTRICHQSESLQRTEKWCYTRTTLATNIQRSFLQAVSTISITVTVFLLFNKIFKKCQSVCQYHHLNPEAYRIEAF